MKRTRLPRWSLRFTLGLLVLAVVVAPLLLVAGWLGVERQFESAMQRNADFSLHEAVAALDAPAPLATGFPASISSGAGSVGGTAAKESALARVARIHHVRIRVHDASGELRDDYNFDVSRNLTGRAGVVVLRPDGYHDNPRDGAAPDELSERAAVREALSGSAVHGCQDSDTGLVVCCAARAVQRAQGLTVIHVQDSAERSLPLLYALRFQLGRITLVILPFALLLTFWVSRRMVGPLEALRNQVLAKVRQRRPEPDLKAPASNETAEVAEAFNTLLDRLAERRRENEAFVADLVHEFKNPVATIRACGESLASNDVTPERAEKLARLLTESSQRLDLLVSQFLELARAEAGMQHESWQAIDLAALLRARVARAAADERWRSLCLELTAPEAALVRGVSERLETVVDNLLENAASFAGEKGNVKVQLVREAGELVLRVRDDGPGIAGEDLPRVFERFFTTRRHDRGTGLGLALVRAIVEAHGGEVKVESELGKGATFTARLPGLPESLGKNG